MLRAFHPARAATLALAWACEVGASQTLARRRAERAFAVACGLALSIAPAFAHALLKTASPPVGGTVSPPSAITLHFSEAVEPRFSGVALSGPKGDVPVSRAGVAPGDDAAMVVKIAVTLAPGVYTVKWRAVSVDTHHTQGHFDFTVK